MCFIVTINKETYLCDPGFGEGVGDALRFHIDQSPGEYTVSDRNILDGYRHRISRSDDWIEVEREVD